MRRVLVLTILCCTMLWACAASGNGDQGNNGSISGISTGSPITNRAVTVSGEVIIYPNEPTADHGDDVSENNGKRAKIETVTDETGKKRKLNLGNINLTNKEILIQRSGDFVEYTQVADGHYYYLRQEGENCYVLYCDRGDMVGSFSIEKGYYFQAFCKYDNRFYVILYHQDSDSEESVIGYGDSVLAVVDFSTGKLRMLRKIHNVIYYVPYFYKNKIKLYESDDFDVCEDVDDDEHDGKEDTYLYEIVGDEEPEHNREYLDYKINGCRYYAKKGKEIRIFWQNLKSQQEGEIFRYQKKDLAKTLDVSLAVEREDIFICEMVLCKEENGLEHDKYLLYAIPRAGGKMKLVADAMRADLGYVYNSKYIFWVDDSFRIHRWNRRTQKEEKVIKTKMYSGYWRMDCTEEGLYLQKSNSSSIELYYMEADGDEFQKMQYAKKFPEEYCEVDGEYYGFR